MVFQWSLGDIKYIHFFRTLLSILADLNNAVVWMVSTCPVISKSCSPCINPLVTAPRAEIIITIVIILTFMFQQLTRPRYLFYFSLSFDFTSVVRWDNQSPQFCKFTFFVDYNNVRPSGSIIIIIIIILLASVSPPFKLEFCR